MSQSFEPKILVKVATVFLIVFTHVSGWSQLNDPVQVEGTPSSERNHEAALQTASSVRYDGVYRGATRESGLTPYLRFYPDGTVLDGSIKSVDLDEVVSWLDKGSVESKDRGIGRTYVAIGRVTIRGTNIQFTTKDVDNFRMTYTGEIRGDTLELKIQSHTTNWRGSERYWFISVPQLVNKPEPVEYLTEVIKYNKFDIKASVKLKNTTGKIVAGRIYQYNRFNPTQITHEFIMNGIGSAIYTITYDDYGEAENLKLLCLDAKGDIIKKGEKPVLVEPFQAVQKTEWEKQEGKTITKIYPCKNCVQKTGLKNCAYVW